MNQVVYEGFDIDLVVIIAVYLFSSHNEMSAGIFLFCMGFLTDIISGGILGLFTLLYLLVYMVMRIASHPIDLLSPGGRIAIIFIAVIFKELFTVALLTFFSLGSMFVIYDLFSFLLSALVTCLLSPFFFHFFKCIDSGTFRTERDF